MSEVPRTDATPATRARRVTWLLDEAFRVPGTRLRFGLDPVLGLVPGLGDVVGGGFGFYLLVLAFRAGAPPPIMIRMFGNIATDMLLGAVPLLGDLLDAGYKSNLRNLALLERYLQNPEETRRKSLVLLILMFLAIATVLSVAVWAAVAVLRALLGVVF